MTYKNIADSYLMKLVEVIENIKTDEISRAVDIIHDCWDNGNNIFICGNGGSAITALHFVTDWSKMVPIHTGRALHAKTLIDNIGLLTAYANDLDYSEIFVQQLKYCLNKDDILIAISGSGNSSNILKAVEFANYHGADTIGLCGFDGGLLKKIVKYPVWTRIDDMQLSEDIHAVFGHIVMKTLCGLDF